MGNLGAEGCNVARFINARRAYVAVKVTIRALGQTEWPMNVNAKPRVRRTVLARYDSRRHASLMTRPFGAVTRRTAKGEGYNESPPFRMSDTCRVRLAQTQERKHDENDDNQTHNIDDAVHDSLQWRLGTACFSNVPSTLTLRRQRGSNRKGSG